MIEKEEDLPAKVTDKDNDEGNNENGGSFH